MVRWLRRLFCGHHDVEKVFAYCPESKRYRLVSSYCFKCGAHKEFG